MRRRFIDIAAALVLGLSPVVAVASPALASTHVCLEYGTSHYCLGANDLNDGTAIFNSDNGGRDIILHDMGFKHDNLEVYRLEFASDQSKCVGFSKYGNAEVRECSGNSNFTNWQRIAVSGGTKWQNNSFSATQCPHYGPFLTSDNTRGDQVYCSDGDLPGEYLAWTPAS